MVRKGLRFLLQEDPQVEVVGEASDGHEALRLCEELKPQVVVMDIAMPRLNGIEAAARMLKRESSLGVLLLSMYSDEAYVLRALQAGVKGYLLKDSAEADLVRAVQVVATGRPFFSPQISQLLLEDHLRRLQAEGAEDTYALLTEREREVLQLLAEGRSNKEAAAVLGLSPYTVETHRNNLMQKLDLHNTAELVLYAIRKKIIA